MWISRPLPYTIITKYIMFRYKATLNTLINLQIRAISNSMYYPTTYFSLSSTRIHGCSDIYQKSQFSKDFQMNLENNLEKSPPLDTKTQPHCMHNYIQEMVFVQRPWSKAADSILLHPGGRCDSCVHPPPPY